MYDEKIKKDTDHSIKDFLILGLAALVLGSALIDFLLNLIGKNPSGFWQVFPIIKTICFQKATTFIGSILLMVYGIWGIFEAKKLSHILVCFTFAIGWNVYYFLLSKM